MNIQPKTFSYLHQLQNTNTQTNRQTNTENEVHKTNYDLQGKPNLIYKIKGIRQATPEEIAKTREIKNMIQDQTAALASLRKELYQEGNKKEASHLLYANGRAIASINKEGEIIGNSELVKEARGDFQKLMSLVQSNYPNNHELVEYAATNRPTNAEVYTLLYSNSYDDYVNKRVDAEEVKLNISQNEQFRKALLFKQEPQVAVLSVQGQVIGSMSKDGFVETSYLLTQIADEHNINRSALKPFFKQGDINSPEEFKSKLHLLFGNDVTLKQYTPDNVPTRA